MPTIRSPRGILALLLCAGVAFSYRLGAAPLLDDPNEGEYAEVAREMVEAGDWISPQLNYVLFLNKPPLTYWLIGAADLAFGFNEFSARVPSALAALAIVVLVASLGTLLFDAETGWLAAFILMATGGFFVESHTARPDLVLVAGIVGSLVAWTRLRQAAPAAMRWPLIGLQVSLAVGLLAKGMLALLIPGVVIGTQIIVERRTDLARRLLHPRAWWLLALLIVPWHLVAATRHPGFFWDYVVNQHVLFFFDRKFPRDSVPVSLGAFWAAFALRLFPWTIFAPLAAGVAVWRLRRNRASGDLVVLSWAATVLLLFSASPSRMEHYSIPALPAMALLLAKLFRDYAHDTAHRLTRVVTAHVILLAALALAGPFVVPVAVAAQPWLTSVHELPALARWVFGLFAVGTGVAAAAAVASKRGWVVPAIVAGFVVTIPAFQHGMALLARVDSSAPAAAVIHAQADPTDRIVYEAPVEYQNCAGFNFYLRRKLDVLRPPDFVPPSYLEPHVGELFLEHEELERVWQTERVVLITDPLQPRVHLDGTVPQPYYIVARDSTRWVVTNEPLH
jgi:4-amino-4-deoxy-L-arabinose transferase-like glycosyltransferase